MTKAIFKPDGFARGFSLLPQHGSRTATVREAVHDGDTVTVKADGNFSIRLVGIDTAEISFLFPKPDGTRSLFVSVKEFSEYLENPFSNDYGDSKEYKKRLGYLVDYLKPKLNSKTASNHYKYALAAQRELESIIEFDLNERIYQGEEFRFFMAFVHEIMDRYGRFLCFLDRDNREEERRGRLTYNERLLNTGLAVPYFIWPNVNPFREHESITKAIPSPEKFHDYVNNDSRIKLARKSVSKAREEKIGIFDNKDPLLLLPFELRYLARRSLPDRYVIDMSANTPFVLRPEQYFKIKNVEDRLFIDTHFVPLFEKHGYKIKDAQIAQ